MIRKSTKKLCITLLIIFQITLFITPNVNAQPAMDGVVNESSWSVWFVDDDNPAYTTYVTADLTNVYLGIITCNTEIGNSQLQIAFKGVEYDWIIKLSDLTDTRYKRNKIIPDGDYWDKPKIGLPEGVQAAQGVADGNVSYEISISKELLGKYCEDFPNNFKLWLMYTTDNDGDWVMSVIDNPTKDVNFYPGSRADWWFDYVLEDSSTESDDVPSFHAPEYPLGTIMSVLIMFSATLLLVKKQSFQKL